MGGVRQGARNVWSVQVNDREQNIWRDRKKRGSSSARVVPDEAAQLQRVFDYVRENLDRDLRVQRLAEITGLSASCFARWFRRHAGIPPHAYVTRTRIERAKELIRNGKLSLAQIALAVGFSSQACLNVTFRQYTGMTPAQFCQRSRKTKDE